MSRRVEGSPGSSQAGDRTDRSRLGRRPVSGNSSADGDDLRVLASGARAALFGKIGGRGVHVVGQVVVARLLGADLFGLYAIGWTTLRIATKVGPLGLDHATIRFGAGLWREDLSSVRTLFVNCLSIALLSGLLIGAVSYLGAEALAIQIFAKPALESVFEIFAFAFPLAILLRVVAAATRASQSVKFAILSEDVGQPAVFLALTVPWLLVWGGFKGVLWATALSFAMALLLAGVFLAALMRSGPRNSETVPPVLREILSFSLPASLAGTFVMLLVWADRLMIGALRPAADAGVYQAVSQSAILFAVILGAFSAIFPPQIAALHHRGEHDRVEQLYRVSTKWGLYLSAPLFVLIFLESRNLLLAVFGPDYARGWVALMILTLGQLGNVATGGASHLLTMTGHQNRWLVTSGVSLIVNIILNLLLIPSYGLEGAAAASAISVVCLFTAAVAQTGSVLRMWPYDLRYLKGLAATVAAVIATVALRGLAPDLAIVRVVFSGAVSVGVFVASLLLLGLDREDEQIMALIRSFWRRSS